MKWPSCIPSQGKKVWAYRKGKLRSGYPKLIEEMFPGIPADLDAAVECHPKECPSETILFFKGEKGSLAGRSKGRSEASVPLWREVFAPSLWLLLLPPPPGPPPAPSNTDPPFSAGPRVFTYDLRTKAVKPRTWPAVFNCTAAVRWLERYYCFQNILFLRFDPLRGDVPPHYPRDARDYFMRCPGRGGSPLARGCWERCSRALGRCLACKRGTQEIFGPGCRAG